MAMHTVRISLSALRQSGIFLTGGLLAMALTAAPAAAQSSVVPAAMVEASPTDISAWGFAGVAAQLSPYTPPGYHPRPDEPADEDRPERRALPPGA